MIQRCIRLSDFIRCEAAEYRLIVHVSVKYEPPVGPVISCSLPELPAGLRRFEIVRA